MNEWTYFWLWPSDGIEYMHLFERCYLPFVYFLYHIILFAIPSRSLRCFISNSIEMLAIHWGNCTQRFLYCMQLKLCSSTHDFSRYWCYRVIYSVLFYCRLHQHSFELRLYYSPCKREAFTIQIHWQFSAFTQKIHCYVRRTYTSAHVHCQSSTSGYKAIFEVNVFSNRETIVVCVLIFTHRVILLFIRVVDIFVHEASCGLNTHSTVAPTKVYSIHRFCSAYT